MLLFSQTSIQNKSASLIAALRCEAKSFIISATLASVSHIYIYIYACASQGAVGCIFVIKTTNSVARDPSDMNQQRGCESDVAVWQHRKLSQHTWNRHTSVYSPLRATSKIVLAPNYPQVPFLSLCPSSFRLRAQNGDMGKLDYARLWCTASPELRRNFHGHG